MTDSDDDDPVPRVVGQDEMLRILRMEQVDEQTTSVTVVPFGETLALRLQRLEDWLLSRGWPPLDGRVFVGDADGNGSVGMGDLNLCVDWILGRKAMPSAGSDVFVNTDVNGDGSVGMGDLNLLVDFILGRITKFPVE